jgi:hypothetical protein
VRPVAKEKGPLVKISSLVSRTSQKLRSQSSKLSNMELLGVEKSVYFIDEDSEESEGEQGNYDHER